jgi:hypothetical protein
LGSGFFCFFASLRALLRPPALAMGRREDDGSGRETAVERRGEYVRSMGLLNAIGLDGREDRSENRSGDGAAARRGVMLTEERAGS